MKPSNLYHMGTEGCLSLHDECQTVHQQGQICFRTIILEDVSPRYSTAWTEKQARTWPDRETAAKSLGKRTENVNEKNTFVETNHSGGRLILFSFQTRLQLLLNVYQNWTLFYSENKMYLKKNPTDSFWENIHTIFSRFSSDMSGNYARVTTWPHGCSSWKWNSHLQNMNAAFNKFSLWRK